MRKSNILYIIDSLALGGAEMLMASTLNELSENYNLTVVYLSDKHDLLTSFNNNIDCICFNYRGKKDFFKAALKLNKIIKSKKIDIVHAQLFWSTLIAKVALPSNVALVITIQNLMSKDVFDGSRIALWLEKITNRKRQYMIFVTREALCDYESQVGIPGKSMVVYNPIGYKYIGEYPKVYDATKSGLKLIAIGNLRFQKNYPFLLEAMKMLKTKNVSIDIYGEGSLRNDIQSEIDKHDLNIRLKGQHFSINQLMINYDAFIMTSSFEGYGIAVVEAMASGLPVILSDIPVLREVTDNNAIFFELDHPQKLTNTILSILNGTTNINSIAEKGHLRAIEIGSKQTYFQKIKEIYSEV